MHCSLCSAATADVGKPGGKAEGPQPQEITYATQGGSAKLLLNGDLSLTSDTRHSTTRLCTADGTICMP